MSQQITHDPLAPVSEKFPALVQHTDAAARKYQKSVKRVVGVALALLAVSAIMGPIAQSFKITVPFQGYSANILSAVAVVTFAVALILRLYRTFWRPERKWYGTRSVTEETKSLAWSYAVGGSMYGKSEMSDLEAGNKFGTDLDKFIQEAHSKRLPLPVPAPGKPIDDITQWMSETRGTSLSERMNLYAQDRIQDQQNYYQFRAGQFRLRANLWNAFLILVEVIGVTLAVLNTIGIVHLDLFGVAGTVVAAGTSWFQFNQYSTLADNYTTMVFRLAHYHRLATHPGPELTEQKWADFVTEVEKTLGAEHTTWRQVVEPYAASNSILG